MKVEAMLTPVSREDVARTFADSMPPVAARLAVAHWALETGWGKACHAYNLGNAKATDGWCAGGNDWCFYVCSEVIGGVERWYYPDDPMCRFRAFSSLEEGAANYLAMLRGNFPRAWAVMQTGDASAYVDALKSDGYFTAPLDRYKASFLAVLAEVPAMLVLQAPPRKLGESPGYYLARLAKPYAGCSLQLRTDELAALVSRGVDDPAVMVRIETNCATFILGVLALAGCTLDCITRPYLHGGIGSGDAMSRLVFELGKSRGAYVDFRPGMQPPVGAILHWAIPGTNDDHVGLVTSEQLAELSTTECVEAGGAGNSVNVTHHDPRWYSWGRPLLGYVDPEKVPMRESVAEPGDLESARAVRAERATLPELVTGHAGELDDS